MGGVENVNETEDLDWSVKAPSEADAFYNKYYANGWTNTWKAMARSGLAGGFSGEIMRDPMNRGERGPDLEGHDKSGQCETDAQQGSL